MFVHIHSCFLDDISCKHVHIYSMEFMSSSVTTYALVTPIKDI